MKTVEFYGRVRRAVVIDGLSRREAARLFGIDRRTVEKMLQFSVPPGYRRSRLCFGTGFLYDRRLDPIIAAQQIQ